MGFFIVKYLYRIFLLITYPPFLFFYACLVTGEIVLFVFTGEYLQINYLDSEGYEQDDWLSEIIKQFTMDRLFNRIYRKSIE